MSSTAERSRANASDRMPRKSNGHGKNQFLDNAQGKNNKTGAGKNDWQILWIAVDRIDPNPFQPRLSFDILEMQELIASVRSKGVQQPILVRTAKADKEASDNATAKGSGNNGKPLNGKPAGISSRPDGLRYQLVAGERRLRACKGANKKLIPAIVRDDLSDAEAAELAILENVQRSNISVIEEARGYKRLMLEFRLKEERLSKKVGKSVATIREMMKLLQLPEAVQVLLFEKKLMAAHGHALLPLAPFEKACVAVARYAVKEKLTAVSLETTPLPNPKELKAMGVLVELDFKTKFNWQSVCAACPFKAYVRSGHSSYCLKPDEWERKQIAALAQAEQQKEEAAQVMEQARQDNNGLVEVEHLSVGSYKDLSYDDPPQGCSPACPCFKETVDPNDPTKKRPICLNPNRYRELVEAQREAEENARRVHFNTSWEAAKAKLMADAENADLRRITVLVALPILRSMYDENGYIESWRQGVEQIAEELGAPVLEEFLSAEDESEAFELLDTAMRGGFRPEKVLLLCACLMLADEARTAIRFLREAPGLDYALENKQISLKEGDDGAALAEEPGAKEADMEDPNAEEVTVKEFLDDEIPNEQAADDQISGNGFDNHSMDDEFLDESDLERVIAQEANA